MPISQPLLYHIYIYTYTLWQIHPHTPNYSRRMANNNIRLLYCTQVKKNAHKCREIIRKRFESKKNKHNNYHEQTQLLTRWNTWKKTHFLLKKVLQFLVTNFVFPTSSRFAIKVLSFICNVTIVRKETIPSKARLTNNKTVPYQLRNYMLYSYKTKFAIYVSNTYEILTINFKDIANYVL